MRQQDSSMLEPSRWVEKQNLEYVVHHTAVCTVMAYVLRWIPRCSPRCALYKASSAGHTVQVHELDDMMEASMARDGVRRPGAFNGSLPQWDGWLDADPEDAAAEIAALLRAARVNATVDPNADDERGASCGFGLGSGLEVRARITATVGLNDDKPGAAHGAVWLDPGSEVEG